MTFYLGTHMPGWLATAGVPLFVSARRLSRTPRTAAICRWALDSGGFTELSMHGRWVRTAAEYADQIAVWNQTLGRLDWAAPQDWMCEPQIRQFTGRTVAWHQAATIASVQELRERVKDVNVIPVLQGWELRDYHAHVEAYAAAGIDLKAEPTVGLGTVCRRQSTREGAAIVRSLAALGLKLHGFGVKTTGLQAVGADQLTSADSLAWSYDGRRAPPMDGHPHKNCANCLPYALQWRRRLFDRLHLSDPASDT